ncbi:MAG: putative transposase [Halioglobus sp.]
MKKTSKGTKKFTKAEKLLILSEAKRNGMGLRKLLISKPCIQERTIIGRRNLQYTVNLDWSIKKNIEDQQLIKNLEKENEALKILLAKKELESKLKDDLLKKSIQS